LPIVIVLLYLECIFKTDIKQIAIQTHRRIDQFYQQLR